ncbi:hypothetical protein TNCV_2006561 [Trichonephila clavipes]|nr:hypothetical protein TNCV_2006561 [Trichonephila clavipes]
MNPDSVSVLMTTAHVSGGAPASGQIRHLLFNFTRVVWGAISWDTRSSLVVSRHFDSLAEIRGRYFNAVARVPFINEDNARHILRDSPNNIKLPGHQIFRQ